MSWRKTIQPEQQVSSSSWKNTIQSESEPLVQEEPGTTEAVLRSLEQGATFGFGDELNAAIESALSDKTYEQAHKESSEAFKQAEEAHPYVSMAGNILGGIPATMALGGVAGTLKGLQAVQKVSPLAAILGDLSAVGKAKNVGQAVRAGLTAGAVEGGLYGAGGAEEGERLSGAVTGAKSGALVGGALSPLMHGAGKLGSFIKETAPGKKASELYNLGEQGLNLWKEEDVNAITKKLKEQAGEALQGTSSKLKQLRPQYEEAFSTSGPLDIRSTLKAIDPSGELEKSLMFKNKVGTLGSEIQSVEDEILNRMSQGISTSDIVESGEAKAASAIAKMDLLDLIENNPSIFDSSDKELQKQLAEAMNKAGLIGKAESLTTFPTEQALELKNLASNLSGLKKQQNIYKSRIKVNADTEAMKDAMSFVSNQLDQVKDLSKADPKALNDVRRILREKAREVESSGAVGRYDAAKYLKDVSKNLNDVLSEGVEGFSDLNKKYKDILEAGESVAPGFFKKSYNTSTATGISQQQLEDQISKMIYASEGDSAQAKIAADTLEKNIKKMRSAGLDKEADNIENALTMARTLNLRKESTSTGVGAVGAVRSIFGAGAHGAGIAAKATKEGLSSIPKAFGAEKPTQVMASLVKNTFEMVKPEMWAQAAENRLVKKGGKPDLLTNFYRELGDSNTTEIKKRAIINRINQSEALRKMFESDLGEEVK